MFFASEVRLQRRRLLKFYVAVEFLHLAYVGGQSFERFCDRSARFGRHGLAPHVPAENVNCEHYVLEPPCRLLGVIDQIHHYAFVGPRGDAFPLKERVFLKQLSGRLRVRKLFERF